MLEEAASCASEQSRRHCAQLAVLIFIDYTFVQESDDPTPPHPA